MLSLKKRNNVVRIVKDHATNNTQERSEDSERRGGAFRKQEMVSSRTKEMVIVMKKRGVIKRFRGDRMKNHWLNKGRSKREGLA